MHSDIKASDIGMGDNGEQGSVYDAVKANQGVAGFGSSTIGKKLFDVLSVVDGDTIKISELGTLRLIGIDTPETKDSRKVVQCFGREASANAHNQLEGKKVYLEFDATQGRVDKYGRTLAYVFREDGYFYNYEAVATGFAHEYTYKTPYKSQVAKKVRVYRARFPQSIAKPGSKTKRC